MVRSSMYTVGVLSTLLVSTKGACSDFPDCASCVSEKGCAFTFGRLKDSCVEAPEDQCSRGLLNCKNGGDLSSCKDPNMKFCANMPEHAAINGSSARFQLGTCPWLKNMQRQAKKFCHDRKNCFQCQGGHSGVKIDNQMNYQRFDYYGCGWFEGRCKSPREGWNCIPQKGTNSTSCPGRCPGMLSCNSFHSQKDKHGVVTSGPDSIDGSPTETCDVWGDHLFVACVNFSYIDSDSTRHIKARCNSGRTRQEAGCSSLRKVFSVPSLNFRCDDCQTDNCNAVTQFSEAASVAAKQQLRLQQQLQKPNSDQSAAVKLDNELNGIGKPVSHTSYVMPLAIVGTAVGIALVAGAVFVVQMRQVNSAGAMWDLQDNDGTPLAGGGEGGMEDTDVAWELNESPTQDTNLRSPNQEPSPRGTETTAQL